MSNTTIAKKVVQIAISGTLLAGVFYATVAGTRTQRLSGGDLAPDRHPRGSWSGSYEPRMKTAAEEKIRSAGSRAAAELRELYSLPTYRELAQSMNRLEQARQELLTAAEGGDAEQLGLAGSEYRAALADVNSGMERLRARVEPQAFAALLGQLRQPRGFPRGGPNGRPLPEWHVNRLEEAEL